MIEGNTIKFGYGDIAVSSSGVAQILIFQQFSPVAECGKDMPDNAEYVGEKVFISINEENYKELEEQLNKALKEEVYSFVFGGWTFDFSKFNEESVRVCIRHLNKITSFFKLVLTA